MDDLSCLLAKCKKYGKINGKDSKYTNAIDISIGKKDVEGVGLSLEKGVEGVELPVEEEVEAVGLSVGEEVDSWLSSNIFSFNLFIYVSCDVLKRSFLLGSFVTTFCDMFILRQLKETWIPSCFRFSQGEGETCYKAT